MKIETTQHLYATLIETDNGDVWLRVVHDGKIHYGHAGKILYLYAPAILFSEEPELEAAYQAYAADQLDAAARAWRQHRNKVNG